MISLRKIWYCALICCAGSISLMAQSATPPTPEPYTADEFPEWANDIRRGEIISVGSFPLSYLFASFAFDIGRYIDKLINDPTEANDFAPLFFGNTAKKAYSQEQSTDLVLGAIGVSVAIALLDFIIGEDEKAKARDKELRRNAELDAQNQQAASSQAPSDNATSQTPDTTDSDKTQPNGDAAATATPSPGTP